MTTKKTVHKIGKLQQRICKCGCGGKFKTLPSSPQKYYSKVCSGEPFLKTRKMKKKEVEMEGIDFVEDVEFEEIPEDVKINDI